MVVLRIEAGEKKCFYNPLTPMYENSESFFSVVIERAHAHRNSFSCVSQASSFCVCFQLFLFIGKLLEKLSILSLLAIRVSCMKKAS